MEQPLYNSRLEVNLGVLRANVRAVLAGLPAGTALIPVLKDNAYGMGLARVAAALGEFSEIRTLAVSHVSEGAALRRAGCGGEILVLGGMPGFLAQPALEHGLTVAVGRPGLVPLLGGLANRLGAQARVEIKLETGLNRLGLRPGEELAALIGELEAWRGRVQVAGVFSHFANTDDGALTKSQYQSFLAGTEQLRAAGVPLPRRHIGGSAASELYPQYHLDAVRIGRRLYMDHPTKPLGNIGEAPTWYSWITNLRTLAAGERLGYGGGLIMERETTAATVGVGYGDGLNPALAEARAPVLVRGQKARLLACCMDQCILDVTGLACEADDRVTFFGRDEAGNLLPSQAVALLIGDNEGCGLTSALSGRVERVYTE